MDLGWLVGYFLTPGPGLLITFVQLGLGLVLGLFIKRLILAAIGAFAVLLAAYLLGVFTLPEEILAEAQALFGGAAGMLVSALLLLSPFAIGLALGTALGIIFL